MNQQVEMERGVTPVVISSSIVSSQWQVVPWLVVPWQVVSD